MPDCDYCGDAFDDEDDYLRHLADNHYEELGRVEKKRVGDLTGDEESNIFVYVGVGVVLLGIAAALYFVFFGGNGGGGEFTAVEPGQAGTAHVHGTIEVVIDGERIDFSQREYQVQDRRFHFEGGRGQRWHVHATDVTLGYGMSTLGIGIDGNSVTFNGTTYSDSDPNTDVTVEVNGRSVDASRYVLRDGDRVRIAVNRTE